jgi:hypothetical protein
MAGRALVRPIGAIAWELRAAWASGRRVALSLDERSSRRRVEGCVDRVAASGAFVVVARIHVPLPVILAVHLPSRLGDSTIVASEQWARSRRRLMAQPDALWAGGDGWP